MDELQAAVPISSIFYLSRKVIVQRKMFKGKEKPRRISRRSLKKATPTKTNPILFFSYGVLQTSPTKAVR